MLNNGYHTDLNLLMVVKIRFEIIILRWGLNRRLHIGRNINFMYSRIVGLGAWIGWGE